VNEADLHHLLTWTEIALGVLTLVSLIFITAPYGRHARGGWGPTLPNHVGWIVMEFPAVALFAFIYAQGQHRAELVPLVFLALWQFHYVQRTFIFPLRLRTQGKTMAASIAGMAILFNTLNAYVNARWISHFGSYDTSWLWDPRFIVGAVLFLAGYAINQKADAMLIALRKPGETGYKIPRGWLYEYVTCPNYFGEILEWVGFAIATWSLPGLAFAIYTASNVGPRAFSNHQWYRETFPDYPKSRKALIPFVA
jgi:hypothetical protein